MPADRDVTVPSPEAVRTAMDRVLRSSHFRGASRAARFLRFVVEMALSGRSDQIKEYVLGVEVFDRGPAFDSTTDTIVRVEAGKLRKRLDAYYRGAGRSDELVIAIPKGTYAPEFRYRLRRAPANSRVPTYGAVPLAVLPFTHRTENPEDADWSGRLTGELISLLSHSGRFRVVPQALDPQPKTGRRQTKSEGTGAGFALAGDVLRHADGPRLSVHLRDLATGSHIWSANFDRDGEDDWSAAEEVAKAISEGVHLTLADSGKR